MSDSSRVMMSARIPEELKRLVDADERANQEVLEAALWREFGGQRKGAVERRIEEQKRKISLIESERNERKRELEEERQTLEALKEKHNAIEERQQTQQEDLQDAIDKAKDAPRTPDNPAIREQAKRVGMTPEEFINELPDKSDGGPRSL
jgi:septal ring factor EnvC (AmiA/AmiB activator)